MTRFFLNRHSVAFSVLAGFALIITASSALATISRINGLGGNGDFFEDDAGVLRWCGSLVDYPDQVILESGNFNIPDGYWKYPNLKRSGPGFGAHYALGNEGRWGTAALFFHDHDDDHGTTLFSERLRDNLSLLYALDLGPLTGGLIYRHGSWQENHTADTFGAGVRMDLGATAYLDFAGEFISTSNPISSPDSSGSSYSESNFNLRARAFIALGQRTALVPLVEIIHEDRMNPFSTSVLPNSLDNGMVRFGVGLNHYPDTDHLLLFNAEFVDGHRHFNFAYNSFEENWTALTLRLGFESRMLSWLSTRGSVGFVDHDIQKDWVDFQDPDDLMNLDGPTFRVNLGASIHLGPGDLDLAFGERYPESLFIAQIFEPRKQWLSATARLLF